MMLKSPKITTKLLFTVFLVVSAQAQSPASQPRAMREGDELRGIVPEKFVVRRRKKPAGGVQRRTNYKLIEPGVPPRVSTSQPGVIAAAKPGAMQYGQIGLTLWRLRRSAASDNGPRVMVRDGSGSSEWTPIRVEASTPLAVDDLVRLSIESSVEGYLYVIDRGKYQDGTISQPKLIFPTTRTRGGDNSVRPGRVIEIPAQDDRPSYFRLTSSRGELASEFLTIVVAKQPIEGLAEQIGSQPLPLDKDLVAKWENTWAGKVEHFELEGGKGEAWTKAEQEAGADATRELTQDDAPPQTIYRVVYKPGSPILINAELQIRSLPR